MAIKNELPSLNISVYHGAENQIVTVMNRKQNTGNVTGAFLSTWLT